jgi:hypothetical protein
MAMFGVKKYIIGLFIGLVLGLWMGVNIGKGQPVWANPFSERNLAQEAKSKAEKAIKDAKKAMRDKLAD